MATPGRDPYQVLGVSPDISGAELRSAYHRLVQLHHPDHNGGSVESAHRFEEIQAAYVQLTELRAAAERAGQTPPKETAKPDADPRLADLERQVREAHLARERARRAARDAAADSTVRPSDEELGYVTTDDSFFKILADARTQISDRFAEAQGHPATRRAADLIDELASKLTGESRPPKGE
jgi:curved DNA-binding protein CbpA